jgi:uncharacterized membrane protein
MKRQIIFVLALFGLILMSYMTYLSLAHKNAPCLASDPEACNTVLSSKYSTFFGIPVSILGALVYASILFLLWKHDNKWLHYAELSLLGVFAAGYFNYLMFFRLDAICVLCELSHLTMTSIFFLSERWHWKKAIFIWFGVAIIGMAASALISPLVV